MKQAPLVVAITGASGVIHGVELLTALRELGRPGYLVLSQAGRRTPRQRHMQLVATPDADIGDATIEVLSDDSMKPGDCLVETPNGSVDARLATQIEMLKQAVKDVML